MLFRRVLQHVKDQNWTAVGIDFVIVVVGVFIGLQVANWNDARSDRQTEVLYLQRLQQELSAMAPEAASSLEGVRERERLLAELNDYFETGQISDRLSGRHCAAAIRSHIMAGVIFYPPTIKELISTGRLVLIRDAKLRASILSFDQANEMMTQLRTDLQIDRLLLIRNHPDLIAAGLSNWDESVCAFDQMTTDQQFLNDFADNRRRFGAYVRDVEAAQVELIETLRDQVTASLDNAPGDRKNDITVE